MNPLMTNWMFFPSHLYVAFAPTANHGMDRLTVASIFAERRSQHSSLVPDYPEDEPPKTPAMRPARPIPTDVPVPESFDVPVPTPMDVPPPRTQDVPPLEPRDVPIPSPRPSNKPRPRSVP